MNEIFFNLLSSFIPFSTNADLYSYTRRTSYAKSITSYWTYSSPFRSKITFLKWKFQHENNKKHRTKSFSKISRVNNFWCRKWLQYFLLLPKWNKRTDAYLLVNKCFCYIQTNTSSIFLIFVVQLLLYLNNMKPQSNFFSSTVQISYSNYGKYRKYYWNKNRHNLQNIRTVPCIRRR